MVNILRKRCESDGCAKSGYEKCKVDIGHKYDEIVDCVCKGKGIQCTDNEQSCVECLSKTSATTKKVQSTSETAKTTNRAPSTKYDEGHTTTSSNDDGHKTTSNSCKLTFVYNIMFCLLVVNL